MRTPHSGLRVRLSLTAAFLVILSFVRITSAATITIVNMDGPGEGFNDPTPVAPVGNNSGTTLGQQRLNAFTFAANIWGGSLAGNVDIAVEANMDPLPCDTTTATLGQAGPINSARDFPGAPVANTWYPIALANALAGVDLDPGSNDIGVTFNSTLDSGSLNCLSGISWYYGLDANPPPGSLGIVATILHEIGHGLGFVTFVDLATGAKALGFDDAFMLNLADRGTINLPYPAMTDAQRVAASQSINNLVWTGTAVNANASLTEGQHATTNEVLMYAPSPQELGSSVAHFDVSLFPNELMEPRATQPLLDVGLTDDLFADIGWSLLGEALGSNDFCMLNGPCGLGQGDCDSDAECQPGLSCLDDRGAEFGFAPIVDVCLSTTDTCPVPVGDFDYCSIPGCQPCNSREKGIVTVPKSVRRG